MWRTIITAIKQLAESEAVVVSVHDMSGDIGSILDVINQIAAQTNLLDLIQQSKLYEMVYMDEGWKF